MNKYYQKQYDKKAKQFGYEFVWFQSFNESVLYQALKNIILIVIISHILMMYFQSDASQYMVSVFMVYVWAKEIGSAIEMMETDLNTYKNCWYEYYERRLSWASKKK